MDKYTNETLEGAALALLLILLRAYQRRGLSGATHADAGRAQEAVA